MAAKVGIEPTTKWLTVTCSTAELLRIKYSPLTDFTAWNDYTLQWSIYETHARVWAKFFIRFLPSFCFSRSLRLREMVPRIGLEPTRLYSREILSLLRLPISPPRLILSKIYVYYIYVPTLKSNSSPRHLTSTSAERNTPFFYYAETILLFRRARAISRGATFSQVPVNWFFMTNRFAWWPTTENAPVSGLRSSTTENRFGLRVRDSTFTVLFISFIILMLLLLLIYYYYTTIISVFLIIFYLR